MITHFLNINFIVVNKKHWLFSAAREKDLYRYLREIREVFRPFGIGVSLKNTYYYLDKDFKFSDDINEPSRDQDEMYSFFPREVCPGRNLNIYIFDKVKYWGSGRSFTLLTYGDFGKLLQADIHIKGPDLIFREDRKLVMSHEIAHALIGPEHYHGPGDNLLHINRGDLGNTLLPHQLIEMTKSPYLRQP